MTRQLTALAVALALGLSMSAASAKSEDDKGRDGWKDPALLIQATLPATAAPHKAR